MIWDSILGVVKGLMAPATTLVEGWQARKQAKLEGDLEVARAKTQAMIDLIKTKQASDIAWENTQITNSGWKDEYWTLVLSIPAVLCFIPGMDEYVMAGFAVLEECPDWYQWALGLAIGAAFGYKKIADFMSLKKGA